MSRSKLLDLFNEAFKSRLSFQVGLILKPSDHSLKLVPVLENPWKTVNSLDIILIFHFMLPTYNFG